MTEGCGETLGRASPLLAASCPAVPDPRLEALGMQTEASLSPTYGKFHPQKFYEHCTAWRLLGRRKLPGQTEAPGKAMPQMHDDETSFPAVHAIVGLALCKFQKATLIVRKGDLERSQRKRPDSSGTHLKFRV